MEPVMPQPKGRLTRGLTGHGDDDFLTAHCEPDLECRLWATYWGAGSNFCGRRGHPDRCIVRYPSRAQ
jgi:hypothetical protein